MYQQLQELLVQPVELVVYLEWEVLAVVLVVAALWVHQQHLSMKEVLLETRLAVLGRLVIGILLHPENPLVLETLLRRSTQLEGMVLR